MLTREENLRLTRVGLGTPTGDLMRRFWQPVALSEELPVGGAPRPVRLLGEDLVLFRDTAGRPGLLDLYCSHRGVDLSYGRVEHGGLRCLYHGWLYDVAGSCLDQPAEPPGSELRGKIRHLAYPCKEVADAIWAYLGPGEPPAFPLYEPLAAEPGYRIWRKVYEDCNYLQSVEGGIDPSHTSFLHRQFVRSDYTAYGAAAEGTPRSEVRAPTINDPRAGPVTPRLEVEVTDFGTRQFAIRQLGERAFLRASSFILPNVNAVAINPAEVGGYHMCWHVPIDDEHSCRYAIDFTRHRPVDREAHHRWASREIGSDYRTVRRRENRYLQDREEMKTVSFAGLGQFVPIHDIAVVELETPIYDRSREHLGYSDRILLAARRALLAALDGLQEGMEPAHSLRAGDARRMAVPAAFSELVPERESWESYAARRVSEEAAHAWNVHTQRPSGD
jgi:phenylpropionate dioxygenase-like ring-hydroxylating dioxygenase large terminal subunit